MKSKIVLSLTATLAVIKLAAQPLQFTITYPDVSITSVSQTEDHGYIISGYSDVYGIGSKDIVLIETDSIGNMIWKKTFGNNANSGADDVAANAVENAGSDGGYFLAGQLWNQSNNTYEIYVLKTDSEGNKIWSKTMYNGGYDKGMSVVNASDGCYVTGWVGNSSKGYLAKLDADGNISWQETVGKNIGAWVLQPGRKTSDGGIIAGGYDNELGSYEMWVVKTNSSGSIIWQKGYAMNGTYNFCYDVCQTNDHGYLLGGGSSGINLVRIDSDGNVVWSRTYWANYIYPRAYSVKQCSDNGFIILSNDIGNTEYLMKIDSVGSIEWTTKYSGGYFINTVEVTNDGGFVFANGSELIKTDGNGLSGCDDVFVNFSDTDLTLTTRVTIAIATSQSSSALAVDSSTDAAIPISAPCIGTSVSNYVEKEIELSIYPNPVTTTCLLFSGENLIATKIRMVDEIGAEVICPMQSRATNDGFQLEIDCSKLHQGIYFISVKSDKGISSRKLLKM